MMILYELLFNIFVYETSSSILWRVISD